MTATQFMFIQSSVNNCEVVIFAKLVEFKVIECHKCTFYVNYIVILYTYLFIKTVVSRRHVARWDARLRCALSNSIF